MPTQTDDSPVFAVEQQFFGGQARLSPTFDPADLTGPDQARYGQLRTEVRSDGETIILPYPMGEEFAAAERVTLSEVHRRLADRQLAGLTVGDKLLGVAVIACMSVVVGVIGRARTLLGHR